MGVNTELKLFVKKQVFGAWLRRFGAHLKYSSIEHKPMSRVKSLLMQSHDAGAH